MTRCLRIFQLILLISVFHLTDLYAQTPTFTTSAGISPSVTAQGIVYGNGIYLAASSGTFYTSSDGVGWTKVTDASAPTQTMSRLAFGNGAFVVVGPGGAIYSSADGVGWTSRSSGTTNLLRDVQYLNNTAFYAVGDNNTIVQSTDGRTWAKITPGVGAAADMLMRITFGNGFYIVGSRSNGNTSNVYRSSTGASNSWTNVVISSGDALNSIHFLKDSFYLFTIGTNIYTSYTGASWAKDNSNLIAHYPNSTTGNLSTPNQMFSGFYDGTRKTMLGTTAYYNGPGSVFTATDSKNFTLQQQTSVQVSLDGGGTYLNGRSFIYGYGGVVASTDGINYKALAGNYYGLATNGSTYVGVGYAGSSNVGEIFSSTDFSAWTERTPSGTPQMGAVIYDGSKFVAAGNQAVLSSADGVTWSVVGTPSQNFNALSYGNNLYVGGDMNAGGLYKSATGASWASVHTDNNVYLKIKYVNNTFFALGESYDTGYGVIMESTDGTNWTEVTPDLGYTVYYFNDVVYDGTKYYFMGMEIDASYNPIGFFSVSTATPSNTTSYANKGVVNSPPAGVVLGGYNGDGDGAFAYSNGIFMGSASNSSTGEAYALYSSDGVNWNASDLNTVSSVYGITGTSAGFKMLGTGDAKFTASFGTLPVTLLDFNAVAASGTALLTWQTAIEQNSGHFTVQRSTGGAKWDSIGAVTAAGRSNNLLNYRFTDLHPVSGNNYYRLALVDLDNSKTYSPVRNVWFGATGDMKVYPNPVKGSTTIQLPGTGKATVMLYSQSGQLVLQRVFSGSSCTLSVGNTAAGVYRLQVIRDGKTWQQTLVVE